MRLRCSMQASPLQTRHTRHPTRVHRRASHAVECKALFGGLKGLVRQPPASSYDPGKDLNPDFTSWLTQQGVAPQQVALQECGEAGRGLVARSRVPRGTPLLQLPRQLLITADTALQSSRLASILATLPLGSGLPEWSLIALMLADLRHGCATTATPQQAGSSSSSFQAAVERWRPYIAVLPQQPETVLAWSESELGTLLRGSPLLRRASTIRQAAAATWAELAPLLVQAEAASLLPKGAITRTDVYWALGIMLSRLVRLHALNDMQALVPWADFLNHSPAVSAHLDWDGRAAGGAGGVAVITDREYEAGEQVYISYGERSAGELLLSYGFAPDPETHPHEIYPLAVGLQAADPLATYKTAALTARRLPTSVSFPLRLEGLPGGLAAWAALCAATPADIGLRTGSKLDSQAAGQAVEALAAEVLGPAACVQGEGITGEEGAAAAVGAAAVGRSLRPELEGAGLREVARLCSVALKAYPTTMDQDRQVAAAAAGTNSTPVAAARVSATAAIRVRERQILARCEFAASSRAREIRKAARK